MADPEFRRPIGSARRYGRGEATKNSIGPFGCYNFLGEAVRTRIAGQHDDLISRLIDHSTSPNLDELQAQLDILFIGGLTTTPASLSTRSIS